MYMQSYFTVTYFPRITVNGKNTKRQVLRRRSCVSLRYEYEYLLLHCFAVQQQQAGPDEITSMCAEFNSGDAVIMIPDTKLLDPSNNITSSTLITASYSYTASNRCYSIWLLFRWGTLCCEAATVGGHIIDKYITEFSVCASTPWQC